MKILKMTLIVTIILMGIGCKTSNNQKTQELGLRDWYKNSFYIGTALNKEDILQSDSLRSALITKEFSSITAENIMKSMFIHPEREVYYFDEADKFVALGEQNNMFVHGHTLIWHSQLASWMQIISDSSEMAQTMESHIKTIVEKYKGRINSWDVVNEALNEDGTLRNSVFYKTVGDAYLTMAFKWASETDPNSDLYYNDYNLTNKAKRAGVLKLVKDIQSKGVKIDGVGMQAHWHLDSPSIEEIEESILDYASLGVKVAITELDVSVLPNPWNLIGAEISQNFENNEKLNPYPKTLPDSMQVKLAKRYSDIFKVFLKHQDKISRVTFWGTSDKESWLNDFPVRGRTNYPLLFDRELKPKIAYDSLIAIIK